MKITKQVLAIVVGLVLGLGSGKEVWQAASSASLAPVAPVFALAQEDGEHGVILSARIGGKGWSDMFK